VYNAGLSTLIRVELQSGEQYAHMLYPGEDSWTVPEASVGGFTAFLHDARDSVTSGIRHFVLGWVHIAFLLVICLLGAIHERVRLVTVFLLAQVGAVLLGSLPVLRLDASLAEIGIALAAVLLAREALRPPEERRQVLSLAACAGAAHGLGMHAIIGVPAQAVTPGVFYLGMAALGMDAALLVSVAVLSMAARMVPRSLTKRSWVPATYIAASACVAFCIGALVDGPASATKSGDGKLELPSVAAAPTAQVGADRSPQVPVEAQAELKARIRDIVFTSVILEIDGGLPVPVSERVDFVTLDEKGVLPRPEPVPENVADAWVGVTAVYLTPQTASDVTLSWEFVDGIEEIPAAVTDPEATVNNTLTPATPVLRWKNELIDDPVPTVSAIEVEPVRLVMPIASLVSLAAALVLLIVAVRRRHPFVTVSARVLLTLALLLGPVGAVAVSPPWTVSTTPGTTGAKRVLARILPNVYRALEFREESAVFDQLSLSVTGETLSDVYLDHRKVLEMEERGGARARVEAVEVLEVDAVESAGDGGFSARAVWTVGGTVTHFGHRHFRQNRYDARVVVTPDAGVWKLKSVELLEEERLR
jgi:hydrogenase/urease accessory protein HupE